MKKLLVILLVVGVVGVLSVGAYAYYGPRGGMMGGWHGGWGQRGGMMDGPRGGGYGRGWMHGQDWDDRQDASTFTCPCGGAGPMRGGWGWQNAPDQSGPQAQAPQVITEEKAKEVAETYITQYLPGYTVEKVEKDGWRPLYFVTIKGENGALQQLVIHGFGGQVMHIIPLPAQQ